MVSSSSWRKQMKFNRLTSLALCLGVVILLLSASAFAGTTATSGAIKYAREIAAINTVYTVPATTITRTMAVVRGDTQNFFVDVTLSSGKWNAVLTAGMITFGTTAAPAVYTPAVIGGGGVGVATATFLVVVTSGTPVDYPVATLTLTGATVKDSANVLGTGDGGTIQVTVKTRDAATGLDVDPGTDTVNFITSVWAVTAPSPAVQVGSAVIDVALNRAKFVGDTATDASAKVGISGSTAGVLKADGTGDFVLATADTVNYVITTDLTEIQSIAWGGVTKTLTDTDRAAGTVTLAIPGNNANLTGTLGTVTIIIVGTNPTNARTLSIAANLDIDGGTSGDHAVLGATDLTVWSYNGTVLTALWVNGNSAVFNSRIYLWNPGTNGEVVADVYAMPRLGQIATDDASKLGTVSLGSMAAGTSLNIKVYEDILTAAPISMTTPYVGNESGNLTIIITIRASGVKGASQTFNASMAFGTYVMP
jgi:hypothetical protein